MNILTVSCSPLHKQHECKGVEGRVRGLSAPWTAAAASLRLSDAEADAEADADVLESVQQHSHAVTLWKCLSGLRLAASREIRLKNCFYF